jgi:transposase
MDSASTVAVAGRKKRRMRSAAEKLRIVEETLAPGTSVALVAREHGVNANQVFKWRKLQLAGKLIENKRSKRSAATSACLLPVTISDAGQPLGTVVAESAPLSPSVPCAPSSGSIHIQCSKAQVRVEGSADASVLRMVLECLLR